jgi:hypothetical protein
MTTAIHFSPAILALVTAGRIDGGQLLTTLIPTAQRVPAGSCFVISLGSTRSRPGWTIECRADTPESIHLLRATEQDRPAKPTPARNARRTY